ncbi:MAG: hypothetical protein RI906_920 [Pseudomonadota bacterium]
MSDSLQAPSIDHLVVLVRDLSTSSEQWQRLGFTLSPRGEHSAHIGTANHTIMLRRDYLELLVTRGETAVNAEWRDLMARTGEGLYGTVLSTPDIDALYAMIRAHGVDATEPMSFERPVDVGAGKTIPARFRVIWAAPGSLPGLKLFACQHLTREAVWLPELCQHANSAIGILGYDMCVPDLAQARRDWSRIPCEIVTDQSSGDLHIKLARHLIRLREQPGRAARVLRLRLQVASLSSCRHALARGDQGFTERHHVLITEPINGIELAFSE